MRQNGSALLMSLMLLVVMTLLAVSAINMSTVNLKIVTNMQSRAIAEASAQDAIDVILEDAINFTDNNVADTPVSVTVNGVQSEVVVQRRVCVNYSPLANTTLTMKTPRPPEDTTWLVTATYPEDWNGARSTVTQGARVMLIADSCTN